MLNSLIEKLPKAELHLHIEGTLEPELMFELAARNKVALKYDSIAAVKKAYQFTNLQSFLDLYYEGMSVLITEQDYYDLTMAYLKRAHADNVVHTEIFFDPQAHQKRGIAFDTVINGIHRALTDAEKELNISSAVIMCFLRDLPVSSAEATFKDALKHRDKIIGVGLDSGEKEDSPARYSAIFDEARSLGMHCVSHAGEEEPSSYIWRAIESLKVERIDHGVTCGGDDELVHLLAKTQLPLTVCPLSNVRLCVFDKMADHNIKELLDRGVCVTVNSDDPAYFGGYMNDNFKAIVDALPFNEQDIVTIIENSFKASFLPEDKKAFWLNEIALRRVA